MRYVTLLLVCIFKMKRKISHTNIFLSDLMRTFSSYMTVPGSNVQLKVMAEPRPHPADRKNNGA